MALSGSVRERVSRLQGDLSASLVVFLVAVPLSLGISLASGAPASSGIIAAIIGGIIVSVFGGAPLQVSGPAAGLSVIVFGLIQKFGIDGMYAITAAAGVLQIVFGLSGAGRFFHAVSPAVIQAMLAGIGVLIVLGQVNVLLGYGPEAGAIANLKSIPDRVAAINMSSAAVGIGVVLLLLGLTTFAKNFSKRIPPALIAITFVTLAAFWLRLDVPRVKLDGRFLSELAPHLSIFSAFDSKFWPMVIAALGLCFVASAESLLCAIATDRLHSGPKANLRRELIGQGLGNLLSGFLGGLPVTGVIVRSSANIIAGAKTKWSGFFHGVWVALFVGMFAHLLNEIPLSALAGLLIYTGIKLVKVDEFRSIRQFGEAPVYIVTFLGVVFLDLLVGIAMGLVTAFVLQYLRSTGRFEIEVRPSERSGKDLEIVLKGSVNFFRVPHLVQKLDAIPPGQSIKMTMGADNVDQTAFEAINNWKSVYARSGGEVRVVPSPNP